VDALIQSNTELLTILRIALPATGGLVILVCIVFLVAISRFRSALDAATGDMKKQLKKHHARMVDAFDDSNANEIDDRPSALP
jgi:hypothetical protein